MVIISKMKNEIYVTYNNHPINNLQTLSQAFIPFTHSFLTTGIYIRAAIPVPFVNCYIHIVQLGTE